MKVFKKILNVIGAILASIITPVLVCVLICAPVFNAVSSFVSPDTIPKLIEKIDIAEFVNSNEDIKDSLKEENIDPSDIDKLLKTDAFGEIVELYCDDLSASLAGEDEKKLSADAISEILENNIDELSETLKGVVPDFKHKSEQEIKEKILYTIDNDSEEIFNMLNDSLDGITESFEDISGAADIGVAVRFIQKSLMPAVYGTIAVLALLIFLFRIVKFKGLLWNGIIFTFCSVLLFLSTFGMKNAVITLDDTLMAGLSDTVMPFVSILSSMFLPFAIAYVVIGVLFIGGFIALFIVRKNKAKKLALAADAAEQVPVETPIDTPIEETVEAPVEEAPIEAPTEEAPTEAPAEEAPTEAPAEESEIK